MSIEPVNPTMTRDELVAAAESIGMRFPAPVALTDAQIEAVFIGSGGRWDGSRWIIEDADLHPMARRFVAPAPVLTRDHVMSALALCPTDLPHPKRCEWIANKLNEATGKPAAPVLTPRGYLLHWPSPRGGRELIWSERDSAGVAISCPVEPVFSFGVRKAMGKP